MSKDIEETLKEAFDRFYRKINHHVSEEFSRLMIEAIKSGDFQMCCMVPKSAMYDENTSTVTLEHAVGLTYIPYREVSSLRLKISELEQEIKDLKESSDAYVDFMYESTKKIGW